MNLVLDSILLVYVCCRQMARSIVPLNFNAFLEKAKLKDDGSNYMIDQKHSEDRIGPCLVHMSCRVEGFSWTPWGYLCCQ